MGIFLFAKTDKKEMCVQESEEVSEEMENLDISKTDDNVKIGSLQVEGELGNTQKENCEKNTSSSLSVIRNSFPVRISFFNYYYHY